VIYADILISWFLAAVLKIYTQHFTRRLHFTQQNICIQYFALIVKKLWSSFHVFQPNAAKVIIKKFSYPKGVLDFKSASFASHAFFLNT
jgi:hypothetical protein